MTSSKKILVVIQGNLGAGKTVLARSLARKHHWPVLRSDMFVYDPHPFARLTDADIEMSFTNLQSVLKNYVQRKQSIVLEGAFLPLSRQIQIDTLIRVGRRAGYRIIRMMLLCDPKVSARRIRQRGKPIDQRTQKRVYRETVKMITETAWVLDTTQLTAKTVLNKTQAYLKTQIGSRAVR